MAENRFSSTTGSTTRIKPEIPADAVELQKIEQRYSADEDQARAEAGMANWIAGKLQAVREEQQASADYDARELDLLHVFLSDWLADVGRARAKLGRRRKVTPEVEAIAAALRQPGVEIEPTALKQVASKRSLRRHRRGK